jgi:hypothetical protein
MALSINDGKTTPVAHIFGQDQTQNGSDPSVFVNRANANGPAFWERLTFAGILASALRPKQKHRVKTRLTLPIAGTVDGNPAVLGTIEVITTVLADQSVATEANMKDAIVLSANAHLDTTIRGQLATFAPAVK